MSIKNRTVGRRRRHQPHARSSRIRAWESETAYRESAREKERVNEMTETEGGARRTCASAAVERVDADHEAYFDDEHLGRT